MTSFLFSLRFRLLFLVLVAIIPALWLILFTAQEQRQRAVTEVQGNAMRLVRLVTTEQESYLDGAHTLLVTLARIPEVFRMDPVACNALLIDLLEQYPYYTNIGVAGLDGDVFCRGGQAPTGLSNIADRAYFQRAVQTHGFAVGEYVIGRASGKPVLSFGYPIHDETGNVKGVVFVGLALDWLNKFITEARLPENSTLRVIDRNGTILVRYPDPERWVGRTVLDLPIIQDILSQHEGVADALGVDGTHRLYAFMPMQDATGADVYVSIGIPSEIAFAEADWILKRNLIALALVTVLAFAATWVGGDLFVLRRVDVLLDLTKRLAAGDLSARTGLRYGFGELDQLARSFDQMAETLQRRDIQRRKAEEQLSRQATRAESLARIARRLNAQLDLKGVLKTVCEETVNALDVPAASIDLFDKNSDALCYAMSVGLPPEYGHQAKPIPRALYEEYIQQKGSVIVIPDGRTCLDLPNVDLFTALNIRTIAITGMLREQQLVGCFEIFAFGQMRCFSEDEKSLLKVLADEAAQAITNARLHDALQREERARANLLHKIITAQEDERKRIARELHDETSQSLTALMVGLDTVHMALSDSNPKAAEHLRTARSIAEGMLEDIHRLIADLRPSLLDDLGLVPAIAWNGERRLNPLGIALHLDADGLQDRLPSAMETSLFRIVQEAMTNAARHAHASAITVRLAYREGNVTLQVADDGEGFDLQALQSSDLHTQGLGLHGMQERVNILGGEFHLQTAPGQGTVITVRLPIPEKEVLRA